MLTLFEISLANFLPVTRAMMTNVGEFYLIFALVHKFCIGFAVVMVITGVFVQETVKVAQTDNTIMLNQRERAAKLHSKKMGALFAVADADGSGRLDKEEFEQVCQDPSVVTWLSAMGIDVSDASTVHALISERLGCEDLDALELVKGMSFVKGAARNIDMKMLRRDTHALKDYVEELEENVGKLLKTKTAKRRRRETLRSCTSMARRPASGGAGSADRPASVAASAPATSGPGSGDVAAALDDLRAL